MDQVTVKVQCLWEVAGMIKIKFEFAVPELSEVPEKNFGAVPLCSYLFAVLFFSSKEIE